MAVGALKRGHTKHEAFSVDKDFLEDVMITRRRGRRRFENNKRDREKEELGKKETMYIIKFISS